jgi:ribosomal protein S18 acetylase RimI-like enzyme
MIDVIEANLDQDEHSRDVLALTAAYARDPMGNSAPLAPEVLDRLIKGLRSHPTTRIFLLYQSEKAVAMAVCFLGFSTFQAKPLLYIHDFVVLPEKRGMGLGRTLLQAVEAKARASGCCKITLEVQEKNTRARRLYESVGMAQALYSEDAGPCLAYSMHL